MKNHVWQPVDIGPRLRLYQVEVRWPSSPRSNTTSIVAASSPKAAARKMELLYAESSWSEHPYFIGKPLKVYQPEEE